MSNSIPKTTEQWNIVGQEGLSSLQFTEQTIPKLGDSQVLVKIIGASLNYRDIIIPSGKYPFKIKPHVIPGSDGAGVVLAIGKHVHRFCPGDRVITIINQQHLGGFLDDQTVASGLGGSIDGTFRSVGAFDEQGLVIMPTNLSFTEAATLSCAGLTAWNAIHGIIGRQLVTGQWVLTQGTGGVSLFALQIAKAAGARVIATTSSDEKAEFLKSVGADHVINYRENPEWGNIAKHLTGGVGVDHVLDVAGPATLQQSVASLKIDGLISVIGFAGGEAGEMPCLLDCWLKVFTARGVGGGSRLQMEEMCRAVEANPTKLRPVVDSKLFRLSELKEAYEYLLSGMNSGKVCIRLD